MKITVFGAGAIGGFLGAKLQNSGADVSLVARGPHLSSIQNDGLTLIENGKSTNTKIRAVEHALSLGPQDYVFITLKSHSVAKVVESIAPMLHDKTAIVWAVNGFPWWYFYGVDSQLENTRLHSVDPQNILWNAFGPENILGCVVYPAAEIIEPGVIKHTEGNRFSLGEPNGVKSQRVKKLSEILTNASLRAPVRPNIRTEIWVKLWGNLSFNPTSVLTHATLDKLCTDSGVTNIIRLMMKEAEEIANKLGVTFPIDVEKRIEGGAAVGAHQTSMLQDILSGRPLELDAMLGSVQELGRLLKIQTPTIDIIFALTKLREAMNFSAR